MYRRAFVGLSRLFSTSSYFRSSYTSAARKTIADIHELYKTGEPISMVTSHDFITSQILEQAKVDINLIGDSLANTTLGYDDTNELTLDEFYIMSNQFREVTPIPCWLQICLLEVLKVRLNRLLRQQ